MHKRGVRQWKNYPVRKRAYTTMYKSINPRKLARRAFRTTYKALYNNEKQNKKEKVFDVNKRIANQTPDD